MKAFKTWWTLEARKYIDSVSPKDWARLPVKLKTIVGASTLLEGPSQKAFPLVGS